MKSWKYFPCSAGRKTPALEGDWKLHATDSVQQLEAWEAEGHNLALDLESAGLCVIDRDGPDGEASWQALCALHGGEPDTYVVKTPRGHHSYFRGALRPSVEKLGRKLDTRGLGSYVLVPGDETEHGVYSVLRDLPIAELPSWVPLALEAASPQRSERAAISELDLPSNIARAVDYLKDRPPLTMGEGADHKLYEIAAKLRELGIGGDTSIELITEHVVIEPWEQGRTDAWIVRKVENAEAYAQNEAGAWGVGDLTQTYAAVLDQLPAEEREVAGEPDPFKVLFEPEQEALQLPTYIAPDLLPDQSVVMFYGPPGSFKSFLTLDIGLTLAAGVPGWGMPAGPKRTVVYVAGEGPRSIARLRRPAWRMVKDIEGEIPFGLVTRMPRAGDMSSCVAFVASLRSQGVKPAVVFLDTYARFMAGLNESDPKEAQVGVDALEYIRRALRCTVVIIHHTGKDGLTYRGSNALEGGVDAIHRVTPHKETKVVAVQNERQKDADERTAPWLFKGHNVGQSLVFQPITAEEHRSLTQADDALEPRKVGAVLRKLNAVGQEAAVTTHVVAQTLRTQPAEEPPEVTQAALDKLCRQLRAAAKGRLEGYAYKVANELLWHLP